jgi:translation initiation factor IF-3
MSSRIPDDGKSDPLDSIAPIRRNDRILAEEVNVISPVGVQLGVMRTSVAMARAVELGLDFIEVAPNAHPPICRIMNFDKFLRDREDEPPNRRKSG